ncbi:hypothetical protein STVIR_6647 [Streptomyces viridochromogenes Tue57]|uniref:Uncharacterized protein n=1 Tax=Streptomyces viridochromogenes Tue57 TaxID=1160705 RepID=L8PAM4_STRVR|nr:hypothetical protein STVIR_6647 [Streptomyces viridochromogenes Tue57]
MLRWGRGVPAEGATAGWAPVDALMKSVQIIDFEIATSRR